MFRCFGSVCISKEKPNTGKYSYTLERLLSNISSNVVNVEVGKDKTKVMSISNAIYDKIMQEGDILEKVESRC